MKMTMVNSGLKGLSVVRVETNLIVISGGGDKITTYQEWVMEWVNIVFYCIVFVFVAFHTFWQYGDKNKHIPAAVVGASSVKAQLTLVPAQIVISWDLLPGHVDLRDSGWLGNKRIRQNNCSRQFWTLVQYLHRSIPANTRYCPNVVLMLAHHLRRWPHIKTKLGQFLLWWLNSVLRNTVVKMLFLS